MNFKMRKVLAVILMLVMTISVSATVFAANGFISSPSKNPAPGVVSFDPADENCTATLVITPYNERENLPEGLKALIEKAYSEITSSEDITKLNADLAALAQSLGLDPEELAVSDFFDIHVSDCEFHDAHFDFDIVLDVEKLSHFVGLLHMPKNGEWELVKDAQVTNNGEHLKFSVESLSPFAIVVDASKVTPEPPQTGDTSMIYVYAAIMVACVIAFAVIAFKLKKKKV